MSALTREQIRAARQRKVVELPVEAWQGTVRIQALTAAEYADYLEKAKKLPETPKGNLRKMVSLLALCLVDDAGAPIFDSKDAAALEELEGDGLTVLNPIFEACLEVNGADEKAIESAGKGSRPTPSGGSSSP